MSVSYPNEYRNYCVINLPRRRSIEEIKNSLENPATEEEVIEDLYELNLMLDEGNKEVAELYPTLSKYNNTTSPNVQTFLAGIYRKTKIPDAFGPLVAMLIRNSIAQSVGAAHVNNKSANPIYLPPPFDPNEEIGGAILDYLA